MTAAALVLAACGGDGDVDPDAAAFCADLEAGMSPVGSLMGNAEWPSVAAAAEQAAVWAGDACPGQLDDNAELRTFLADNGVAPDG